MREPTGPSQPFRFGDPSQRRIYERLLQLVGPGPAAYYRDACAVAAGQPALLSETHAIGHFVREVESALRAVLEPPARRAKRLSPGPARRALRLVLLVVRGGSGPPAGNNHRETIRAVLKGLGVAQREPLARKWFQLASEMHRWAHRAGLAEPRPANDDFRRWWTDIQTVFGAVLDKFQDCFADVFPSIDGFLAKERPTKADVKEFGRRVPHTPVTYQYFFSRLQNPTWLRLLKRHSHVFRHPPEPEIDDEGTLRVPRWPQSKFLARMSERESELVCGIIEDIETSNVFVACDFVDAALQMPAALAVRLVPKAELWLAQRYGWSLPEKLGRLASHLARGDEVESALTLARELLQVRAEQRRQVRKREGDDVFRWPPQPKPRFDEHHYAKILERDLPDLVAAAPSRIITLLCETLSEAIRCSLSEDWDDGLRSRDLSEIWRRSIAQPRPYDRHDLKNILVTGVCSAARQAVQADPSSLAAVVELLESSGWPVFQRLTLHVLRSFPDSGRELIVQRLTDRGLLLEARLYPEYDELAGICFSRLAQPHRQAVLNLVDAGPELPEDWLAEAGQQEIADRIDRWKRDRVARYAEALPAEWTARFDGWLDRLGPPRPINLEGEDVVIGPASPRERDNLAVMSVEDIAEFLKTWQPPEGVEEPSARGLREILGDVVGEDPTRFAEGAKRFEGVDATYVGGLVSGFRKAAGAGRPFNWEGVLRLCKWAVSQPREIPGRDPETARFGDWDPHWGWARQSIATLLDSGFGDSETQVPFRLRALAWEILQLLTRDPDPAPDDERRNGGSNMDPMTSSINSVRGGAMHAVVSYALWVRRHLDDDGANDGGQPAGFDDMPEVRDLLEDHLDVNTDPSVTVRAVYGRHLFALAYLDDGWLRRSLDLIFPPQDDRRALRDAAWQTYLVYGRLGKSTFVIARREYERAVDQLGPDDVPSDGMRDPTAMLAEHVMVLYWWGEVELEKGGGLLRRFFDRASPAHRARALRFLGTVLGDHDGPIATEIRDRLEALWAYRFSQAQAATSPDEHGGEMEAYGRWFISGKFDDRWAIDQLRAALELYPKTEMDHEVVERLATRSNDSPMEAVMCARRMCEGDQEGWMIPMWNESLRQILMNALNSGDALARQSARALVSYLASIGFTDFRDLLGPKA